MKITAPVSKYGYDTHWWRLGQKKEGKSLRDQFADGEINLGNLVNRGFKVEP